MVRTSIFFIDACLITLYLLLPFWGWSQHQQEWVQSLGGNGEEYSSKIVVDQQANVYGVGHFQDTLNALVSYGNYDVLVFKYASNGTLLWQTQLGSIGEDLGKDIAIDDQGHLYLTGHFRNRLYYDNDSLLSAGNTDAFVAKLDTNGTILWVKGMGHAGFESGTSIACDPLGNIYTAGTFEDTLAIDNQVLTTYGALNNYVIKLNTNGALVWQSSLGTPTFHNLQGIEIDAAGELYVAGYFRDLVNGPLGQLTLLANNDILLTKFDVNGNQLWWQRMGGAFDDFGFALHLDGPLVYVAGVFQDTATFGPFQLVSEGEFDAFLVQANSSGTINWVQQIGGPDDSKAFDIGTLENGNVCLVGYFEGTAFWGTDSLASRNPRHVPSDIFIAEYNANASYQSVRGIGGVLTDLATGVAIVDSNHIYVSGQYRDSVNFDSTEIISVGASADIFVVKYSKHNWTGWTSIKTTSIKANLYPNPMQNVAQLELVLEKPSKVRVLLYNALGKVVEQLMPGKNLSEKETLILQNKGWTAGMYYIHIITEEERMVLPFIVR